MFCSALVLAAGRGSRMGQVKQLLRVDGRPMLAQVIDAALGSVADEVVVVLGYEAAAIRSALARCWSAAERVRFVDNADYERGQSSSLAVGIAAVDQRSDAVVVLLGDQPAIDSGDIDRVIGAYGGDEAVAVRAVYRGVAGPVAGHPTLIGRGLWGEVRTVSGDVGAREVLARHGERVLRIDLGKPPPIDFDTPNDYAGLLTP